MDKTTDAKSNVVTSNMLTLVLVIDIIVSIIWGFAGWNYSNSYKENIFRIMHGIPDLLNNLAAFSAVIFGITIVRVGIFTKGGTEYYPQKYGYRKLKNIIDKYNEYENYDEVAKTINKLLKPRSKNQFNSEYFDFVNILQETSPDFNNVWNDFNYYSSIKNKKNVKKYYEKLKKYIYIRVYEEYKKN
ncbi:hypothetical protein M5L40_003633 [Clostridium botulinum]|nr:hypothetical protein [Clostridium botulinum]